MTVKNYFIRCDSGFEIGIGHVMRCFSLAETLADMICDVSFICKEHEGNIIDFLVGKKIKVFKINDENNIVDILKKNLNSSLIIDNYEIDEEIEKMIRPYVKEIIVIDDLANRKHDCDLLLDQSFFINNSDRYNEFVPEYCMRLFGPEYALLRREFLENRKNKKINFPVKNIFVSYGGIDPTDETSKVLIALRNLKDENLKINVIVGNTNIQKAKIKELCSSIINANFISTYDDISKIMIEADLAFGAGGSSTWERMCLGIPSIVTIVSKDQIHSTEALSENYYVINMGLAENVTSNDYEKILSEIDSERLNEISKRSYELVDGKGTIRMAEQIINLEKIQ